MSILNATTESIAIVIEELINAQRMSDPTHSCNVILREALELGRTVGNIQKCTELCIWASEDYYFKIANNEVDREDYNLQWEFCVRCAKDIEEECK